VIGYLDCSTGVSGDKFLGALLDIGEASGAFTGGATDDEDGSVPASRLSWELKLGHCTETGCHEHPLTTRTGVAGDEIEWNNNDADNRHGDEVCDGTHPRSAAYGRRQRGHRRKAEHQLRQGHGQPRRDGTQAVGAQPGRVVGQGAGDVDLPRSRPARLCPGHWRL